ncbi:hypothetical protein Sru01_55590 [Sphaerisporangium rufum]|uniref:GPP34 family phosphoprotein n=1 Tax=Sphaerisporangium rufum TaxID=1381558 RepID=A0A919V399_9ACTN|nr:GPP34 family phosphoprotein [Sphaerisporangium rufum]GII80577.1 hypothetical protein Sru01_55590 [Sphaerisporangium rufum]
MNLPETLPERLYLLAYDPRRGRPVAGFRLGYLLRAGILAELLLRGDLTDTGGRPKAARAHSADPLLDPVLQQIAAARPRSWQRWVSRATGAAVRDVRARLAAGGWIRLETHRVLGIFPYTKVTVRDPRVPKQLASTAASALKGGRPVERLAPADAALAALAAAVRLRTVLPRAEWRGVRHRAEELGDPIHPVPGALKKAVQQAEAAAAAG